MSSHFDASEFIDDDLHPVQKTAYGSTSASSSPLASGERKAPSREEVELKVNEMQQRLSELKHEQQRLERERAALEETRRRQTEFTSGRQEMIQNLTRGVALIEEAELSHRREAEQRNKSLHEMREALNKVLSLNQEGWNKENFELELTRALTTLDNARMEWNSARVKFSELNAGAKENAEPKTGEDQILAGGIPTKFSDLCRLGLALNWPLCLLGLMIFLMLWLRR